MEQTNESAQKSQVAAYVVQNATQPVCPLECMPRLLIERSILKSSMNREVHVRFCEEQGMKFPCVTRLCVVVIEDYIYKLNPYIFTMCNQFPKCVQMGLLVFQFSNLLRLSLDKFQSHLSLLPFQIIHQHFLFVKLF
jgi:hypothetical protein